MKTQSSYTGIDVSKKTLHLATSERFIDVFDNTVDGVQALIERLRKISPDLIVLEASGGYERLACDAFQDANLPVSVVQPSCVRHFAKSIKVLAKTDEIDAKVIARFGEATKPAITPKTPENIRKIRALSDRRRQVVEDRVRECNRLETCSDAEITEQLQESIARLKQMEEKLNQQIDTLRRSDRVLKAKSEVMMAQKGIGERTTTILLAQFPELGSMTRHQVAALAGLAPHAQESGNWKGKRRIYGGRAEVRKAMYMAAKSAARWCPVISVFYQRLRQSGKPYNVALIACARKMLIRLNTLLKDFSELSPAGASAT
jgi:transposase